MTRYGVGPKLLCLQTTFWNQAQMVCRAGGSFGKPFGASWGVTQGGPLSSLMFNVCVNAVIREWLRRTIDKKAAHGRFEGARRETVAFFVDDGLVGSRDPIWLQGALNVLVFCLKASASGQTSTKQSHDVHPWEYTCSPHRRGIPHATVRTGQPHRKAPSSGVQHLWREPSGGIPLQSYGDAVQHVLVICSQSRTNHRA
jgi:hypothetical protein